MQRSKSASIAFQYVIQDFFNQDMNGPIALSLLQATMDTYDIRLVLDFTEDDINDLHYYTSSVNSSNIKTPVSVLKELNLSLVLRV